MMNHQWKYSISILVIMYLVTVNIGFANANTNLDNLNPNEYKEQPFKDNTEYFHNDTLIERRKNISEMQKQLKFLPNEMDVNEEIKKQLFKEGFEEHKTLTYESTKLLLFTTDEKDLKLAYQEDESTINTTNIKTFYISIICSLVLLMFLLILPRIIRNTSIKPDA